MKKKIIILSVAVITLVVSSCSKEDAAPALQENAKKSAMEVASTTNEVPYADTEASYNEAVARLLIQFIRSK